MLKAGSIGVFDSGYGGLTILSELQALMPQYDYCYLGDNSRAPYGSRSYDIVYSFTKQAVDTLFGMGCNLVVLACNTASAKALRSIQQYDLPQTDPEKRVLGVIRPTAEIIGDISKTRHVGVLGTIGTIQSGSYQLEIQKLHPDITVTSESCPMWVPLVESNEFEGEGADYFVKKYLDILLQKDADIDSIILGCTHYPLLYKKIRDYLPSHINVVSQGKYVAESLKDYMDRHPNMDGLCSKGEETKFFTTEAASKFSEMASVFLKREIQAERINIE